MLQPIRKLYYALPVRLRFLSRRILFLPVDILTYKKRKREVVPPTGRLFIGSGDFVLTGNRFAERLTQYANLNQESTVLDIGCGIGRLARPLTQIITPPGKYCGFDVVKMGITWCNKNISARYPHFEFKHVALSNDLYNNSGQDASAFSFPYYNNSFSIAVALSVYTHLLPDETNRYLSETARVLQTGGVAFFTFFIDDEQKPLPPSFNFPVKRAGYALMNEQVSRANVQYTQAYLFKMIEQHGLEVKQWLKGRWNSPDGIDLQDTLILVKK